MLIDQKAPDPEVDQDDLEKTQDNCEQFHLSEGTVNKGTLKLLLAISRSLNSIHLLKTNQLIIKF